MWYSWYRRTSVCRPSFPAFVVDEAAVENLGVHIPGPLSLEIRTQRSQVNDSCLKYCGNQEPVRVQAWGEAAAAAGGGGLNCGVSGPPLACQFACELLTSTRLTRQGTAKGKFERPRGYQLHQSGRSISRAGCLDSVHILCRGPPLVRTCQSVTFCHFSISTFD